VETNRLALLPMSREFLEACLEGRAAEAERLIGAALPGDWLEQRSLMARRLEQLRSDPSLEPWLLRAVKLRESGVMVGHAGFHTAPDPDYLRELAPEGVEIGYTIYPEHRRRGYATEAVIGLMDWASAQHGVRRFVLSIRPDNEISLRIARNLGFVQVSEVRDEEDGLEGVFVLDRVG
jgi:RimJ/RimL family protein N-acetyltransferase